MNAPPLTVTMERAAASVGKRWPVCMISVLSRFLALTNTQPASECKPCRLPDAAAQMPAARMPAACCSALSCRIVGPLPCCCERHPPTLFWKTKSLNRAFVPFSMSMTAQSTTFMLVTEPCSIEQHHQLSIALDFDDTQGCERHRRHLSSANHINKGGAAFVTHPEAHCASLHPEQHRIRVVLACDDTRHTVSSVAIVTASAACHPLLSTDVTQQSGAAHNRRAILPL